MDMHFYGLIGEKLGHSFSPDIHKFILKNINVKGNYNLFEVSKENLSCSVKGLKALGCSGSNVTIPYKVDIMQYLDEVSSEAQAVGAINTIDFKDNKLIGYNTDYYGFGLMLKKNNVNLLNKRAVILGTGGVSKAVYHYLLDNNIGSVIFVSRDTKNVISNYNVNKISYEELETIKNSDIIINCTPCGMYPNVNDSPISKDTLSKFNTAVDLIYNPIETKFLKYARELQIKSMNGLYMLIAQAVVSEEIWNDIKIDIGIIDKMYDGFSALRSV
ncbi:shikimate dehydrogenase [Clostridium sp. JN-1]|jgi:shikimate dehydrogenase|uniref:shikimate dehydrogenase n=1 Tax=Clostridium sp. JN-1 TaxID=2483110 RepID=UPI001FA9E317|nr:shikimate dehydrogenase [Clostridium sp. JN-1]